MRENEWKWVWTCRVWGMNSLENPKLLWTHVHCLKANVWGNTSQLWGLNLISTWQSVICHLYLSVVMRKTKKARWVPPPDPNDFVDPNTRGWHTLTDEGWKPLQPSATLQLPPSCGTHQFFVLCLSCFIVETNPVSRTSTKPYTKFELIFKNGIVACFIAETNPVSRTSTTPYTKFESVFKNGICA